MSDPASRPVFSDTVEQEIAAMPVTYQRLSRRFVPRAVARLRAIAAGVDGATVADTLREVHNLKGTAGSYGLRGLHDALAALEVHVGSLDAAESAAHIESVAGALADGFDARGTSSVE